MLYSYTVDVQKGSLSPGNAEDMKNIKGTVTIKGDGTETNNPITVTDNATVTLKDVKIKVTSNNTPAIRDAEQQETYTESRWKQQQSWKPQVMGGLRWRTVQASL